MQQTAFEPASTARPWGATYTRSGDIDRWAPALHKLMAAFDGVMAISLPDGSTGMFGAGASRGELPAFTLRLGSAAVVRNLLVGSDPLRFAEAYFRSDIDIDGDLFAALALKEQLQALKLPLAERLALLLRLLTVSSAGLVTGTAPGQPSLRAQQVKAHTKDENREAIAFHYDLSNDFYGLWLDEEMVYSCAYFESPDASLAQAQRAKLDHICRKLQLMPGEQLLDIGCGWGALILHAARHYGVHAHGITLSQSQYQLARQRIDAAGLQNRVSVELRDYRDLAGRERFHKVSSVGMFEHVGLKNLPTYFDTVHRLLKPHGLFLNHGITHEEEGWGQALSSRFINRYVFPDGELDTISNVQRALERAEFEILDVEGLRPHYARTLRHWVRRLEQQHGPALTHVNEATYRIWRLYMAASAMEFESGELGLYQILTTPQGRPSHTLAPTRRHVYP